MISTNHTELPPLKMRCNRMGVHIPTRNPSAAEIIPYVEERLADHQKHFAKTMDPSCAYYGEWKSVNDDLTDFLNQLRATQPKTMPPIPPISPIVSSTALPSPTQQNNLLPKNPSTTESTLKNQQVASKTQPNPGESLVGSAGLVVGSGGFKPTSSESNTPKPTSPSPSNSTPAALQPFDIRKHLDTASMRVCEDLQEYLSGRSPIDNLTPQQQNVILLLLEDNTAARVAEVLAQPEPYGFNFKTTDSSLNRFRERIRDAAQKRQSDIQKAATDELIAQAAASDDSFQSVIQRLLKRRLILSTNNPLFSAETIDSLITSFTKLRKQSLAERKQLHAEKNK